MTKFQGNTSQEAILIGLKELNLTKDTAEIKIISEGKKGFLGIGKQAAVVDIQPKLNDEEVVVAESEQAAPAQPVIKQETVEVSPTKTTNDEAIAGLTSYLESIIAGLGEEATVTVKEEQQRVIYQIDASNPGLLIGKHGRVLNALQYIAQVYLHRTAEERLAVVVDVGDYRQRREQKLLRIADQTVKEVRELKQPVFLDPMPAFERKQIHAYLSQYADIATHSEGDEPFRYLVVDYQKTKTL